MDISPAAFNAVIAAFAKKATQRLGEFKAQGGLIATPANDAEASCDVVGFNLVYVPRRQDPVEVQNPGARYTSQASQLVQRAKPGDIYYFDNVRVRCEGDDVSRQANTLVFKIR